MTEADWIKVIRETPDDDTVRWVFADYLIEQGQDIRARFVQIQLELAIIRCGCRKDGLRLDTGPNGYGPRSWDPCIHCKKFNLKLAEREFIIEHGIDTLAGFECPIPLVVALAGGGARFRRGFLEEVSCTAEEWIEHGDTIYAATPLREVQLTTYPFQQWQVVPGRTRDELELELEFISLRWPGVKFILPATGPSSGRP